LLGIIKKIMKTRILQRIFRILTGLIVISLVVFGIQLLIPKITELDVKNISVVITTSATLIVGLGAVLISQNRIKKRELAEAHREKKIELYTRFNEMIFKIFAGNNENVTGNKPNEQKLVDFMMKFKRDLMFRASPKVIRAMNNFEKYSDEPNKIIRYVDDLYRAMREDIGLSNFGLNSFELMQIILKDKSEIWKIK